MKFLKKFESQSDDTWNPPTKERIDSIKEDIINIITPLLDDGYKIEHQSFDGSGTFRINMVPGSQFFIPLDIVVPLDSRKEKYDGLLENIGIYSSVLYSNINEISDRIKEMVDNKDIGIYFLSIETNTLRLKIQGAIHSENQQQKLARHEADKKVQ